MWLVSHSGFLLVVDVSAEKIWSFLPSASSLGQKLCESEIVSSSLSFGLTGKKNQLQLYQRTNLAFCLQTNVAAQRTVRWGDTQCFAWIKLERNPRLGLTIEDQTAAQLYLPLPASPSCETEKWKQPWNKWWTWLTEHHEMFYAFYALCPHGSGFSPWIKGHNAWVLALVRYDSNHKLLQDIAPYCNHIAPCCTTLSSEDSGLQNLCRNDDGAKLPGQGPGSFGSFGSFGSLACEEDLTWKMPPWWKQGECRRMSKGVESDKACFAKLQRVLVYDDGLCINSQLQASVVTFLCFNARWGVRACSLAGHCWPSILDYAPKRTRYLINFNNVLHTFNSHLAQIFICQQSPTSAAPAWYKYPFFSISVTFWTGRSSNPNQVRGVPNACTTFWYFSKRWARSSPHPHTLDTRFCQNQNQNVELAGGVTVLHASNASNASTIIHSSTLDNCFFYGTIWKKYGHMDVLLDATGHNGGIPALTNARTRPQVA